MLHFLILPKRWQDKKFIPGKEVSVLYDYKGNKYWMPFHLTSNFQLKKGESVTVMHVSYPFVSSNQQRILMNILWEFRPGGCFGPLSINYVFERKGRHWRLIYQEED